MAKNSKSTKKTQSEVADTKWIIRAMAVITILSIVLFVYFRQKAKQRFERTSAEQQALLAQQQSKINLVCSGLLPLDGGHFALYGTSDGTTTKLTNFDISTDQQVVSVDGSDLGTIDTHGSTSYSVKALSSDGTETNLLSGDSVLNFSHRDSLASSEGLFEIATATTGRLSLTLPQPPTGWKYAVWTIQNDDLVLLDRFAPALATSTHELEVPLGSGSLLIGLTVEPIWYDGERPSPFTVLDAEIPAESQPGQTINLKLALDSVPYCIGTGLQ